MKLLCRQYSSVNTGPFETSLCALETFKLDCIRRMMCQWKEINSVTPLKFHKVQQYFYHSSCRIQVSIPCILAIKRVLKSCSSDLYVSDTDKLRRKQSNLNVSNAQKLVSKGPVLTEEYCLHSSNFIRLDGAFFTLSQY